MTKTPESASHTAQTEGMEALAHVDEAGKRLLDGYWAYNHELLNFLSHRLEEDAQIPKRLADCHEPREAVKIYLDFTQEMMREYAEEMQKLARMSGEIMTGALSDAVNGNASEKRSRSQG